jgi:hypothetical protein
MKRVRIADLEIRFDKKARDRKCNICLQPGPLSNDHIPPKGVAGNDAVLIDSVLSRLATGKVFHHKLISQDGVKFRTICIPCNNRMHKGDRVLKALAKNVRGIIESSIYLPRPVVVTTFPNLLMRCVLGHLVAATSETSYTPFELSVRPCVQDHSVPIPRSIHFYYWVYPFRTIRIWREFGSTRSLKRPVSLATLQLLKFYPLAFLVADTLDFRAVQSLDSYRDRPLTQSADLLLQLDGTPPEDWPERPGDGRVTVLSETAIKSIIARKRHDRN